MNLLNIIQILKQSFPEYSETQMKMDINSAYILFCNKTSILKNNITITLSDYTITNSLSYADIETEEKISIQEIESIDPLDADGRITDAITYYIMDRVIYFKDKYSDVVTSIPSNVISLRIKYINKPTKLSDLTDEIDARITEEMNDIIIYGVSEKYCARKKDYQGAQYNNMKWKEGIVEGKKYANINSDSTKYNFLENKL